MHDRRKPAELVPQHKCRAVVLFSALILAIFGCEPCAILPIPTNDYLQAHIPSCHERTRRNARSYFHVLTNEHEQMFVLAFLFCPYSSQGSKCASQHRVYWYVIMFFHTPEQMLCLLFLPPCKRTPFDMPPSPYVFIAYVCVRIIVHTLATLPGFSRKCKSLQLGGRSRVAGTAVCCRGQTHSDCLRLLVYTMHIPGIYMVFFFRELYE